RWKIVPERQDSAPFEPGMVTTDEPGIYEEGRFGIRIENELLCVPDRETEYGRYLKFETVTYCPIDLDAVDVSMLTAREKALLNEYHRTVYETLAPHLTEEEAAWLAHETREV
ncbi:MAG: M24 family metallopeptidase C-terminal domain-containing protein, partial [Lachnospiraceae bacterium]|nr:M24 family metallopeptidase C-terminal domain-containing protein [Lachnospiraceae bacterium]